MTTLETDFQSHLLAGLNAPGRPFRCVRQNSGTFRSMNGRAVVHGAPKGAADLSGIAGPDGLRVEVEVKGQRTPRAPEQDRWQRLIERLGGVYVQVRYDEGQSMTENVARAVVEVDAAIADRRLRGAGRRAALAIVGSEGR